MKLSNHKALTLALVLLSTSAFAKHRKNHKVKKVKTEAVQTQSLKTTQK